MEIRPRQEINFFNILFSPDKDDLVAFIICLPIVYFLQVVIFEQHFQSYFDSLNGFSFFIFMALCYFSYWAFRYGYSSLFQAVQAQKNIMQKHNKSEIVPTWRFFGLWFSILLFYIATNYPNSVF